MWSIGSRYFGIAVLAIGSIVGIIRGAAVLRQGDEHAAYRRVRHDIGQSILARSGDPDHRRHRADDHDLTRRSRAPSRWRWSCSYERFSASRSRSSWTVWFRGTRAGRRNAPTHRRLDESGGRRSAHPCHRLDFAIEGLQASLSAGQPWTPAAAIRRRTRR